jgi:hypothetical protein
MYRYWEKPDSWTFVATHWNRIQSSRMIFTSSGLDIRTSSTTMAISLIRIKVLQPEIVQLFVRCGGFTSVGTKLSIRVDSGVSRYSNVISNVSRFSKSVFKNGIGFSVNLRQEGSIFICQTACCCFVPCLYVKFLS